MHFCDHLIVTVHWLKALLPAWHKIDHIGHILPSHWLGFVLKSIFLCYKLSVDNSRYRLWRFGTSVASIPTAVSWWVNKGRGQWKIFTQHWSKCFELPSVLWHLVCQKICSSFLLWSRILLGDVAHSEGDLTALEVGHRTSDLVVAGLSPGHRAVE